MAARSGQRHDANDEGWGDADERKDKAGGRGQHRQSHKAARPDGRQVGAEQFCGGPDAKWDGGQADRGVDYGDGAELSHVAFTDWAAKDGAARGWVRERLGPRAITGM